MSDNEKTNFAKDKKLYDRVLCSESCLPFLDEVDTDSKYNKYCEVYNTSKMISDHKPLYIKLKKNKKRKIMEV